MLPGSFSPSLRSPVADQEPVPLFFPAPPTVTIVMMMLLMIIIVLAISTMTSMIMNMIINMLITRWYRRSRVQEREERDWPSWLENDDWWAKIHDHVTWPWVIICDHLWPWLIIFECGWSQMNMNHHKGLQIITWVWMVMDECRWW